MLDMGSDTLWLHARRFCSGGTENTPEESSSPESPNPAGQRPPSVPEDTGLGNRPLLSRPRPQYRNRVTLTFQTEDLRGGDGVQTNARLRTCPVTV